MQTVHSHIRHRMVAVCCLFDCIQLIHVAALAVLSVGSNAFLLVAVYLVDAMMKRLAWSVLMDTWFDFYDYLECANQMAFYQHDCQDEHNILNRIYIVHPS